MKALIFCYLIWNFFEVPLLWHINTWLKTDEGYDALWFIHETIRCLLTPLGFKTMIRQGMMILYAWKRYALSFGILPLAAYGVLSRRYMLNCTKICTLNLLGYHPYCAGIIRWQREQISQELVFKPDYIIQILNSQHGWIFIMVINNQYYDWGFLNHFSAMAITLSMDMIYSTMEGIVPSCCSLTTRHLGATLFKLKLHQICKSHVTASMHHGTWGLMQSHFYLLYWKTRLITS